MFHPISGYKKKEMEMEISIWKGQIHNLVWEEDEGVQALEFNNEHAQNIPSRSDNAQENKQQGISHTLRCHFLSQHSKTQSINLCYATHCLPSMLTWWYSPCSEDMLAITTLCHYHIKYLHTCPTTSSFHLHSTKSTAIALTEH